jgi:hypothetical protein
MRKSRVVATLVAAGGLVLQTTVVLGTAAQASPSNHHAVNCKGGALICTEVNDSEKVFGKDVYVGHDEPSTLFYSDRPGSGNRMRYHLTLPTDPPPTNPTARGRSYNFELHPAFWFGMAMCDTQSYPELLSTCTPDSDSNIVDPAISPRHPGTAFMEMQFYPPGWAAWPAGNSCDATQWCAALNIDSLSNNPVTGQQLNAACAARTGVEYVNFAFLTKNGKPQPGSPPNPVDSTLSTFTPSPSADLFMASGDRLDVTLHDSNHGLVIVVDDLTSGQSGSMTTSAANGFGQVKFAPGGSTCKNLPYDFHPMYSTSSEKTRVPWAAHSYNVAFADEIGHFDFCSSVNGTGACTGKEGIPADREATDADDTGCFPASSSTLVQVSGCLGTNTGFDGVPYQPVWPDGNTTLHPTTIAFSSPRTGNGYSQPYARMAFEADLPRIEFSSGTCNRQSGAGCALIPTTDDTQAAAFYPFFSIDQQCRWNLGNNIPGRTVDAFGGNAQYGTLLPLSYTGTGGHPLTLIEDFRQVLSSNPCP